MIAAPSDLLVIGGLTIDRFADGSSAPGGSVLHIARAAGPRGLRVAVTTVAGPEPEAQAGLRALRSLTTRLDPSDAAATATFVHRESPGGRRLWLSERGGGILSPSIDPADTRAILVAPIADEISPDELAHRDTSTTWAAILQGFLRSFAPDGEVMPVPLSGLAAGVAEALSGFDLLVASREDLAGEAADPPDQLAALRRAVGPRPALVVTDGVRGIWLEGEHLPVPRLVDGVSTVGAGDVFAAFMLAGGWPKPAGTAFLRDRARAAMLTVAEVLEERRTPKP
jgi:sugar/nucleoside kinase (ribokinase family)